MGCCCGEPKPNTLTEVEKADGWKLLFDGTSTDAWIGFRKDHLPEAWQAVDGTLTRIEKAGDIVTKESFGDFELSLDWKISEGGNSGIFFRVTDEEETVWRTGPEQQIIDNDPETGHRDGANPKTMVGSLYALIPPKGGKDYSKPAGEWNTATIRAVGPNVAFGLNGTETLRFEIGSPEFEALVADSKFTKFAGFAKAERGRIALQDHGDPVWFRDIKIRPL